MNSLVLAPFSSRGIARLRALGGVVHEPWPTTRTIWDPEDLGARLDEEAFDALVVEADFLFEELFAAARWLRIAAMCRGALNQVDLAAATDHGVVVVHTPGRNARAVAEFVIAQLFALARHTAAAERYVRDGRWREMMDPYARFEGRELAGATLGLVGLGAVGRATARLAGGIGMRVIAHDPYAPRTARIEMVGLDPLLRAADFVSVHVPDTPETAGLLDAERIAAMRSGAYLVSVTAPSVIDQAALAAALADGRIAGAALDVHEAHPIPPNAPLIGSPNALLTPHIGGATRETIERHSAMTVEAFERFVAGRRPRRLANPEVWRRRR